MPKVAVKHVPVHTNGEIILVGYFPTLREGFLGVRFSGPKGNRLERMTKINGDAETLKNPPHAFDMEASAIIAKAYVEPAVKQKAVTWDDAIKSIQADSEATMIAYTKALRILRDTLDGEKIKTSGPGDITPELAERFTKIYESGTYTRSNAKDAKRYSRKPASVDFMLRQLSAVWSEQFLGICAKTNPWQGVKKRAVGKKKPSLKKVPTDDEMGKFFDYVNARYPQWKALQGFLELKRASALRLEDVCLLQSEQVADGCLTLTESKTGNHRVIHLPDELFSQLREVAGEVYLWDGIIAGLTGENAFRRSKRHAGYSDPQKTVYWCVSNVFREFSEEHPKHAMSSHAFRRWAVTTLAKHLGGSKAAYHAGMTEQNLRNYLDKQQAFEDKAAVELLAKPLPSAHQKPTNKPNIEEQTETSKNKEAA